MTAHPESDFRAAMAAAGPNPLDALADKTANPFAERAVIAALCRMDPDDAARCIIQHGIRDDLFANELTREAFVAIRILTADGVYPDAATLTDATSSPVLIEVETSLKEHVSTANLPHWVARLKACQRERLAQAAKQRLVQATAHGATKGELAAIVEAIPETGTEGQPSRLRVCNTTQLRDAELSSPRFLIDPLAPRDQVTLFGGHGGGGKTSVGYVLCAHVATGTDWAGLRVLPGKVLVVSYEDPEELMLWRFKNIATEYGLNIDAIIRNVRMIDATEAQPIMREVSERGIKSVQPTQDGSDLVAMITGEKFDLVLIDNTSDAFDGDENNRRQVRQFVRYLAGAIRVHHGALLLLAHIDKTAARYGSAGNSYSGSTAWHNSVRSRLALIDSELRQEKLNVGKPMEATIKLRFSSRGVPVLDSMGGDETREREHEDDAALLACFAAAQEAGAMIPVGETGPATTWHALSVYPECPKPLRDDKFRLKQSIARLLRAGAIRRDEYRNANRKLKERLVLTAIELRQFAPVQELEHNRRKPTPLCASSKHRGVGIGAAHLEPDCELAQPTASPPVDSPTDSPLARRILATLDGNPGGLARDDLARLVGNGKGSSPAMIDAEVNRLLLARRIATVNGRLVGEVRP